MDPYSTLACQTCNFRGKRDSKGWRLFYAHVCKEEGGARKRKKCSDCGVKVTHEERHKDTQGNYLCDECSRTALAKKRGTKPPTSGGAAGGAGAAAGGSDPVSTQCVPTKEQVELTKQLIEEGGRPYSLAKPAQMPTQADWDAVYRDKCSFCGKRRVQGSDFCQSCAVMGR